MSVTVESGFSLRHLSVAKHELACPMSPKNAVNKGKWAQNGLSITVTVHDSVCSAVPTD